MGKKMVDIINIHVEKTEHKTFLLAQQSVGSLSKCPNSFEGYSTTWSSTGSTGQNFGELSELSFSG